jgi:hypothetical protein
MNTITITVEGLSLSATLNESPTARQIWDVLPIQGTANVWGNEIYFDIPVRLQQEPDARAEMEVGELAYWPPGQAFCIFFGVTPASIDDTPRAASPVNVFGQIQGDATVLRNVPDGAPITVAQAKDANS